jgi:rhamnulokinase
MPAGRPTNRKKAAAGEGPPGIKAFPRKRLVRLSQSPMAVQHHIACDLGAESGRVMLGKLADGRLELEEIHRFSNGPVRLMGSIRWDVLRIFEELKTGLRAVARRGLPIASLSVDSWGVDYVLLNSAQPLLAAPFHYRDARTEATYEPVRTLIGPAQIFAETGIQFMPINTLYHLASDAAVSPALLEIADCFLTIGDYFNYLFCGVPRVDESNASTTQLYNPATHTWSAVLIEKCGLPKHIFPLIVPPATVLGPLLPEVARETGLEGVQVVATCSHDTGAAVAAVPAGAAENWAYLSSGTWSLLGVELAAPLINETVRAHNFTNEAGYGGTTRFLKNIVGLWILQESRRAWVQQGRDLDYATLNREAFNAEPFRSLIHPDAPRFARPDDMPAKIIAYCQETGQPAPETPGQFTRCILESLALLYRGTLDEIEALTGKAIHRLHIVGGGSQSELLNQFAANAVQREVIAGPVEATAIGNVLLQAVALGQVASIGALREVVRSSFNVRVFPPLDAAPWQQAYERFQQFDPCL